MRKFTFHLLIAKLHQQTLHPLKMKYLFGISLLFTSSLFAQVTDAFLNRFLQTDVLNKENVSDNYLNKDFSTLWSQTEHYKVLGMIGTNHQRIRIAFTTITKNQNTKFQYAVRGKSKVKNNICDFSGVISIDSILEVHTMHFGIDNLFEDSAIVAQGVLFATYEFKESTSQNHSGVFNGQLITKWYINAKGELKYDNIQAMTDRYMNNAYIGTWTPYGSNQSKVCNWADYRIPNTAPDFDCGAGEFSPCVKYYERGWEQYQKAWLMGDEKAKKEEQAEWW